MDAPVPAPDAWTEDEVADRLKDLFAEESPPAGVDPFTNAAAVLASFDLETLRPFGPAPSDPRQARAELAGLSTLTRNQRGDVCWTLRRDVRRQALKGLIDERRVEAALAANPDREMSEVQKALEAMLREPGGMVTSAAGVAQLRGRQVVLDWLQGLLPGLPEPATLRDQVELASLLAPFRVLVGDYFAGRQKELAVLADYVNVLGPSGALASLGRFTRSVFSIVEEPPLFVHGPGGIGKSTLIAKFILDHIDRDDVTQFPFAYLDLDRPGLVAEEPITLLIETLRQLAAQYPRARPQIEALQREWIQRIARTSAPPVLAAASPDRQPDGTQLAPAPVTGPPALQRSQVLWSTMRLGDRDYYLETFAAAVRALLGESRAMLLVVDTLEEVQLRSAALVGELFGFLEQIQRRLPFIRTVLSGRVPAVPAGFTIKELALTTFDVEAATAYLTQRARVDAATAEAVARQVTGSPLTLKLAADLLAKEQVGAKGLDSISAGFFGELWRGSIEAQLYTRVLGHITDPDVRKLAHPGLVLRRITPDIIAKVLAETCGVVVPDEAAADALFDKLRAEVVLVTERSPNVLVHRPDLRGVMLEALRRAEPDRVREIHERAVAYYEQHDTGPESRAEEIYHRLSIGFDRATLVARWQNGMEQALATGVAELPPRAQGFLGARLQLALSPDIWAGADLEDWEMHAIREVRECLRVGRIDLALGVLAERKDWTAPDLHVLEAETLARDGRIQEAEEAARAALELVPHDSAAAAALRGYVSVAQGVTQPGSPPRISDHDVRALADALTDAFGRRQQILSLLDRFELPAVHEQLPPLGDLPESRAAGAVALAIVTIAAQDRWLAPLVLAARRANPGNARLWRFAQRMGLTARGYPESDTDEFARMIAGARNPAAVRAALTILEAQTCSVRIKDGDAATGFLVGPDLVLTSAALFAGDKPLVDGRTLLPAAVSRVAVVFDRWVTDSDITMPGIDCGIHPEGMLAYRPQGTSDSDSDLGYALIRLDRAVGAGAGAQAGRRGWMALSRKVHPEPKTLAAALRYDRTDVLSFSYSQTGMRKLEGAKARLNYELESGPGEQGAPVFDQSLAPVAMQLGRESRSWLPSMTSRRPQEGVPVDAIARDLQSSGIALPAPPPPPESAAV